jgi:hypothetical protein
MTGLSRVDQCYDIDYHNKLFTLALLGGIALDLFLTGVHDGFVLLLYGFLFF